MSDEKKPLKLALHGFDARGSKTLVLYLGMYCKNIAEVVTNQEEAEADVFDFDIKVSKTLFESHLQNSWVRPVIVFSLSDNNREEIFHIKKPVNADNMMQVLAKAKKVARNFPKTKKTETAIPSQTPKNISDSALKKDTPEVIEKNVPSTTREEPTTTEIITEQSNPSTSEDEYIMQSLDDWFDL
jgi:hypothetical protein